MNIKIYQINMGRDDNRIAFMGSDEFPRFTGSTEIDSSICDCSGERFGSLNEEQLERYGKQFRYPENFIRINDEIKAIKYKPETSRDER